MTNVQIMSLLDTARGIASENFCCRYSSFTVGAALLSKDGRIFTGFNIENHGIQSICAERCAFSKALSSGAKEFEAIAIVGKRISDTSFKKTLPCGYCRQFMSEYGGPDLLVYTADEDGNIFTYTMRELLPEAFSEF